MRAPTFLCLLFVTFPFITQAQEQVQGLPVQWEAGKSLVGTDKIKIPDDPRYEEYLPICKVSESSIVLANRGIAVTKIDLPRLPVSLEFDWTWVDGRQHEDYHDALAVVLWTSGRQKKEWAHEIEDGLAIKFMAHQDRVVVHHYTSGERSPKDVAEAQIKLEKYVPHRVRIYFTRGKLKVLVGKKEVIDAAAPETEGERFAIYNREPVASARHVSIVSNLDLRLGIK